MTFPSISVTRIYFSNFVPFLLSGNSISGGSARGSQGSRRAVKIDRRIQRRRASPRSRSWERAGQGGLDRGGWEGCAMLPGRGSLRVTAAAAAPPGRPGQGSPRAPCAALCSRGRCRPRRALAALPPFSIASVCLFCSVYRYSPGYLRNRIKDSSILSQETSSVLPRLSSPVPAARRRAAQGAERFNSFLRKSSRPDKTQQPF